MDHIRDLTPDEQNARSHSPRNIGEIADSLRAVGAARSIVIDENGRVLAGNGLLEAAAEAGITRVKVVEADGETIVAVRRRGLSEAQKAELSIRDNRAGESAGWNYDVLTDVAEEHALQLGALGFTEAELKALERAAGRDDDGDGGCGDTSPQLNGLEFRVVVDCRDEAHQRALLERFELEGLPCRALMS